MNRPPHAPAVDVAVHASTPREEWCGTCRAFTLLTAGLLLLTRDGVAPFGEWSWCEVCEDPDNPLPPRRIDRAGP